MGAYVARSSSPQTGGWGAAREPLRGGSAWARLPWGVLAGAVGVGVWLLVDPRTPDLAGQVYRANLFREAGFLVYDGSWYGGHDLPGYSLVFPPLAALIGVRAVGAAAVLASATLFDRIARTAYGWRAARWGAVWFAVAALGDVWSGRVTFALGVSVGLGAVLALVRDRPMAAALLAGACALCSPVAGVLVALAGLTHTLAGSAGALGGIPGTVVEPAGARSTHPRAGHRSRVGRWHSALVLGVPPAVVVLALVGLFPEGGWEPYPLYSFLATVAVITGFLWALPPGQRLLRVGALVYLAACVACVAVHTPVGANIERYGVLLAGPLLLCAVSDRARRGIAGSRRGVAARGRLEGHGGRGGLGGARGLGVAVVLCGIAVWTAWGPVRETQAVAGNASTSASYYLPVERFVARVETPPGEPVRVEVPFTRGHWEAAWLAPKVSLARGWEKQLDERYDGVLLGKDLTAARYRRWLEEVAVRYVALPDAPLDPSSAAEGRLIEGGLSYLREVLRTRHWRIYEVLGATPLAEGPGALSGLGHDWFTLRARAAGRFEVRLRYTRYWTVTAGAGCVARAPGGWTVVTTPRAGALTVRARFSVGRALGFGGGSCRAG
jgi:hypothetical protein